MSDEIKYEKILNKFFQDLPKFSDGRIDYSNSNEAPVLTCFVKYGNKLLLLKRSDKVRVYQGLWNSVAGYLDEKRSLKEKVLEELYEELKINTHLIRKMKIGKAYELIDQKAQKTWIIFPVLVELKQKPKIKLDWEHTSYKWIKIDDLKKFKVVPGLDKTLAQVL